MSPEAEPSWYAVRTRSNHEHVAAEHVAAKGVEAYLPAVDVPSVRRDRRLVVHKPLFPGYFFARVAPGAEGRVHVLRAPGVVRLVGFGGSAAPVPEWQIASIRTLLATRSPFEVLFRLVPGARVRVVAGPLRGMEGVLVSGPARAGPRGAGAREAAAAPLRAEAGRLVVSIELLGRSLSVALGPYEVEPAT